MEIDTPEQAAGASLESAPPAQREGLGTWLRRLPPAAVLRIFSMSFAAACLLVLLAVLVAENQRPVPAVQPEEDSKELLLLKNLLVSGQIVTAKNGLLDYVRTHPTEAQAHYLLANSFRSLGSYNEALKHMDLATALDPYNAIYLSRFAEIYRLLGWMAQSAEQLSKLLDFEPDNLYALSSRAEAYYLLGRYEDTLRDAEFAVITHPDSVAAHYVRGRVMLALGRIEEATQSLNFVAAHDTGELREQAKSWLQEISQGQHVR